MKTLTEQTLTVLKEENTEPAKSLANLIAAISEDLKVLYVQVHNLDVEQGRFAKLLKKKMKNHADTAKTK